MHVLCGLAEVVYIAKTGLGFCFGSSCCLIIKQLFYSLSSNSNKTSRELHPYIDSRILSCLIQTRKTCLNEALIYNCYVQSAQNALSHFRLFVLDLI